MNWSCRQPSIGLGGSSRTIAACGHTPMTVPMFQFQGFLCCGLCSGSTASALCAHLTATYLSPWFRTSNHVISSIPAMQSPSVSALIYVMSNTVLKIPNLTILWDRSSLPLTHRSPRFQRFHKNSPITALMIDQRNANGQIGKAFTCNTMGDGLRSQPRKVSAMRKS